METLIVNLYAGPGAGKSTAAAYIFAKLKMAGVDCEYVPEYAKDRTWQGDHFPLEKCQLYVTGKQALRIARLVGKVRVIITDSPIALGSLYTDEQPYKDISIYEGCKYKDQLNIFLNRGPHYNPMVETKLKKKPYRLITKSRRCFPIMELVIVN